jgi:hypothetical protein
MIKPHYPVPCLRDHTDHPAGESLAPVTLGAAGVTSPGGRIVGETDRMVHLFPTPAGQTIPDELCALRDVVMAGVAPA